MDHAKVIHPCKYKKTIELAFERNRPMKNQRHEHQKGNYEHEHEHDASSVA